MEWPRRVEKLFRINSAILLVLLWLYGLVEEVGLSAVGREKGRVKSGNGTKGYMSF